MTIKETHLKGCFIIEPRVFKDVRGYFFESFNAKEISNSLGLQVNFVQDNESYSSKGVIRGLHYQTGAFAQTKLIRVLSGAVLDVVVDIRKDSLTYGQHFSIELSGENKKQLFIPKGFAHGFSVLSDTATFFYKCDNYYNKEAEKGIIFNDTTLNIDWKVPVENAILSSKDLLLPNFSDSEL
tara:strand:+ start:230325 stop:230870 length:546 start_codon:yes stop_codon:yes gene_type:complete